MSLLHELKRRRVFQTFALYIVGAWVVIQVAQAAFEAWELPMQGLRFVWLALVAVSPLALLFAWRYDITAAGIVRTQPAKAGESADLKLRRSDYAILATLLTVGAIIVYQGAGRVQQDIEAAPEESAVAEVRENSIAVLPFKNLDMHADTGYFSDGITEEILHRLSTLGRLHVLASNSSFAFRNSDEGPAGIAARLGVRYLLQGSVRRDRDFVRVTARLLDQTGFQVWSDSFDRKLEGIFAIQAEIAGAVSSRVVTEIVPAGELPAGRTTENMEAYDAYLSGRAFFDARTTGWRDKAIAGLRRAIELDPGYAPPHAILAAALVVNTGWGPHLEEGLALARRAVELDPLLAEGHAVLGMLQSGFQGDHQSSLASLRRAIELDPSLAIAYTWITMPLGGVGKGDEASEYLRRGLEIDPLNSTLVRNVAFEESWKGDFARAEQLQLRLVTLPEPPARAFAWQFMLYERWGRLAPAIEAARGNLRLAGEAREAWFLALVYAQLGMEGPASHWFAQTIDPSRSSVYRVFRLWRDTARLEAELQKMEEMSAFDGGDGVAYANLWGGLMSIRVGDYQQGAARVAHAFGLWQREVGQDGPGIDVALLDKHILTRDLVHWLNRLAFAWQQSGRMEDAAVLLQDLEAHYLSGENSRRYPGDPAALAEAALLRGLLGDRAGALATLERAYELGWAGYYEAVNDPAWAETLAAPGFAGLLEQVEAHVEEQRTAVEAADAAHDFAAEFESFMAKQGD
jgi:TolB-like protein/tetratricopeptide (TPR) repeat protein